MLVSFGKGVEDAHFSCVAWDSNEERLEAIGKVVGDGNHRILGWVNDDQLFHLL